MIAELINQWEENKSQLEEYFRATNQSEYSSYEKIVKKVFEICLPYAIGYGSWNLDRMTIIDDGDYQGTQIFVIPNDSYQPSVSDYVITHNYYGSCSGCDTLLSISEYSDDVPTKEQVEDYMSLCLHLIEKMKVL